MDSKDSEVVYALKKGSHKAFEVLYEKYKNPLYFFALKFLKSPVLAEEMVHDVFVKIWEIRFTLNNNLSFKSFLFTITKNHVLNTLTSAAAEARLKKEILLQSSEEDNSLMVDYIFKEYAAIAQVAISKLPSQRQRVFTMCRMEGKSYEEVAEILGIAKGTVSDHMVKAMRAIKEYMLTHADLALAVECMMFVAFEHSILLPVYY